MHKFIRSLAVILFTITFSSAAAADPTSPPVIRVLHPRLTATLDVLYSSSSSARDIVDELESTDLIVHVVALTPSRRHEFTGTTHFVVAAGRRRVLRLAVDETLSDDR